MDITARWYVLTVDSHPPGPLVIRLHSEIDQIHLSIEAQCVTTLLPLGDCHNWPELYWQKYIVAKYIGAIITRSMNQNGDFTSFQSSI